MRPNSLHHAVDDRIHLPLIQRIAQPPVRLLAQRRDRGVQPFRMVIDADHDGTFARHDLRRRPADAIRRRGDQRDLVLEPHRFPLFSSAERPAP